MLLEVTRLTAALCRELEYDASVALNGAARDCEDEEGLFDSCFACELCASGRLPNIELSQMLSEPVAFVAVHYDEHGRVLFLGCVTARPLARGGEALMMSNLCVAPAARKHGVGQALVGEVLGLCRTTYCIVARYTGSAETLGSIFRTRTPRLLRYYAGPGVGVIGCEPDCFVRVNYATASASAVQADEKNWERRW